MRRTSSLEYEVKCSSMAKKVLMSFKLFAEKINTGIIAKECVQGCDGKNLESLPGPLDDNWISILP